MAKLVRILVLLLIVAVLLGAGWLWLALHWAYSDGDRAGFVQKFSRKGWLCKTWEGELAMVTLPGAAAEVFPFTVRDPAVASAIEATLGQRAVLHYEEHRGLPTSCFGETRHFVVAARSATGSTPAP